MVRGAVPVLTGPQHFEKVQMKRKHKRDQRDVAMTQLGSAHIDAGPEDHLDVVRQLPAPEDEPMYAVATETRNGKKRGAHSQDEAHHSEMSEGLGAAKNKINI